MAKKPKDDMTDPILSDGSADTSNSVMSLLSSIEIIESLKEEQKDLAEKIKEEKARIKGMGFDTKIVNKVLSRRARKPEEVEEEDMMIERYEESLEEVAEQRRLADQKPAAAKKGAAKKPTADLQTPPEDPPAGAVMENGRVKLPEPGF